MTFNLSQLNRWVESEEYEVSSEATIAYARATNDMNPRHLSGELAPPLFSVRLPVSRTMKRANDLITSIFCLHGEHDIWFHRPIIPGMRLRARAAVVGAHQRSAGVALTIHCETRTIDGVLVNEQYETTFAHRAVLDGAQAEGMEAPDHRSPTSLTEAPTFARVAHDLTDDQTRRYCEASGDRSEYTYDDAAARARGLPGAILHGLLTMALCGRAIIDTVASGDSTRLRRLAARFSGLVPMISGQQVITSIWPIEKTNHFGFEASDHAGTGVIRHGIAEIAP